MSLAAPWGLAALGLIGPLVVWYVLRSRRPRQPVASTLLWSRTTHTVAAAVPWQRFRPNATFWLVLAAVVIGAVALARPFVRVPARLGDHTILIVDTSGSMLGDEGGPTRLELARRSVEDLLATMGPEHEVSLVEAGARGRVLVSAADADAARDALSSLRPTHGQPDLVDAFTLAAALERPGQDTVLHLLTDGVVAPRDLASAPAGLLVTAVGEDQPNLAVSRVTVSPQGAGSSEVLVTVRNLSLLPARARVTLAVAGQDVVAETVGLASRGTKDLVLRVEGGDGDVLTARVEPVGDDATDALSIDDVGHAVLAAPRVTNVLVVGDGNVFLEAALAAVPGVEVTTAAAVPASLDDVDLLVVDRAPAPLTLTIPTLLIAPTRAPLGIEVAEDEVELPAITFQAPGHELLAEVDLSDVAVAASTIHDAPELTPIASGPSGPLVQSGRLGRVPTVLVSFDLLQSNLPLQPAWPVLAANAVTWLTGPPAPVAATAGSQVTLRPPAGVEQLEVAAPGGATQVLDAARPLLTVDQVGLWDVTWRTDGEAVGGLTVAVNADLAESDLSRPRPGPPPEDYDPVTHTVGPPAAEGRRDLGRPLLAAVLLLAVGEWLWSHRRRGAAGTPTPGTGSRPAPPRVKVGA